MVTTKFFPPMKVGQYTMKLCRLSVDGFKNIKKSTIVFDDIVALVSLNSYGKSNLLQAVDFGIDFILNNEATKQKMMAWSKGIPLNKETASRDYRMELELTTKIADKSYRIVYGYQFRWIRNDETGACIIAEWLKVKLDEKNQKYNLLIDRASDKALYRSSETGRCTNKIAIEPNNLIVNKLKAFDDLYYYEIVKQINSLKVYIDRHLDASRSYTPDPIVRKNRDILEVEGSENLPRVIFNLRKELPEKYELLTNAYMQLFPQVKEVIVRELTIPGLKEKIPDDLPYRLTNEVYVLYVTDENLNQPISFEDMSDGAKRIFLLLTNIIIADINNLALFAVEEPENSIHPSLLQSYLRVLSQFIGDCRIMITSHSPYIIQYLELSNIYIGLPYEGGIAQFKRIRKSAQNSIINEASNSDMSMGDYLFELISGSTQDLKFIEKYLENDADE